MACFVVLVPVGSGFAEERQKIKQTELHFDLPKKNAEEQCREVDKIYKKIFLMYKRNITKIRTIKNIHFGNCIKLAMFM